jgi:hypothetical protein
MSQCKSRRVLELLLVATASIALTDCGGDNNGSYPAPGTYANLQIVAASVDAPPIDVLLDGHAFVTHLDYGHGTGELPITPNSHSLTVQIETPGAPTTVIGPTTLNAAANMDYVVAVEGTLGSLASVQAPGLSIVTFPHQLAIVPPQSTRIQVLNASADLPPVDVYLSAPGASFSSATQVGTAPPGGSVGPMDVSSSDVWLSVGAESRAITLAGGTDLVFSVVSTISAPGDVLPPTVCCQFAVAELDAFGSNTWLFGPALLGNPAVRFINDSPDAPALAVTSNGNLTNPVVSTLPYEGVTSYARGPLPSPLAVGVGPQLPAPLNVVEPGLYEYDFSITPASNLSDVLASQAIDLRAGDFYSLYASGRLAQIVPFVTRDDVRGYSTQARLRFIQGSPSAQLVDVYLTASGAGIASAAPTYPAMPFGADTDFVSYVEGAYDLTVTLANSKTAIIGPTSVTLYNGGVYTFVARDAPGGGAPYGLILD